MAALFDHPWWLLLFAAAGAIAIFAVGFTLFSGIGDRPPDARLEGTCTVESREFLLAVSGTLNAPLQTGGTAQLLNNGEEFYPAILKALREAEHTINLMLYIWEPGKMSEQFFDVLTERARAGVQVRVMVDGLGGHKAHQDRIEAFRAAGGKWWWFHPARFGQLTRVHKRNHRRAIIVDGRIGFTGGAAVMDKWMGNGRTADVWRDSMVEVRGCLASNLQAAFTSLWTYSTGEMLVGEYFYGGPEEESDRLEPGEPISHHVNVVGSPSGEAHPMRALFWISFRAACESIYITNPYFVPDPIMQSVLMERARAGVDVRVLVPGEKIDIALIRWASQDAYEALMEAGVRIYEYQPAMIHQKTAVMDAKWSIVGSANLDVRSKELNQENALGILDTGFARQVTDTFIADLAYAREIDLAEFRKRPFYHRLREKVASLFEEQF